jgi:ligand-binding sensor domain-containing protein
MMNWTKPWLRRVAPVCAVLLLSCWSLFALDPAKSVYQFNCRNWTRQSGLPAELITGVTQTKDGYIWIGTQKGLVRFDGIEHKLIGITPLQGQNQEIRSLCSARDGGMWLSVFRGRFGFYDGRKYFPIKDERWAAESFEATPVLETPDGAVWTGSVEGLGRWVEGKPLETFMDTNYPNSVLAFRAGSQGRVWVGTVERGDCFIGRAANWWPSRTTH